MRDEKRLVAWFVLLACSLSILWIEYRPVRFLPLHDFVEYWTAARLFIHGGNPYSAAAMLEAQRAVGWVRPKPVLMLNPPFTLPLIAWLAAFSYKTARLAWLAVSIVLYFGSTALLWRFYGDDRKEIWPAALISAVSVPSAAALMLGQITPLILAGVALFIVLHERRPFLAGMCLLAIGLKPHLLYLASIAIGVWIIRERRWTIAAGAATAYSLMSAIAVAVNHSTLGYARDTVGSAVDTLCGVGGALRLTFGWQHVWLQFAPSILGLIWFAWWWRSRHGKFTPKADLPLLIVFSLCTATYVWWHDVMLGVAALIPAAVAIYQGNRYTLSASAAYIAANLAILMVGTFFKVPNIWFFWTPFLWLLLYLNTTAKFRRLNKVPLAGV